MTLCLRAPKPRSVLLAGFFWAYWKRVAFTPPSWMNAGRSAQMSRNGSCLNSWLFQGCGWR